MSIITQPFKIGIKTPELTKVRAKAATVRILKDVWEQYKRYEKVWAHMFCPEDKGELMRDLIASSKQSYVQASDLWVGIVLFLDSMMPYSQFVNDAPPEVTFQKGNAVHNFFNANVDEINDMLPTWIKYAIEREEDDS